MLVGGASRRFGSDKSLARYGGDTLLTRALNTLNAAGLDRLAYVGGQPRLDAPHDAVHLPDLDHRDPCALRGVLTALEYANDPKLDPERAGIVVVIACDIPLLQSTTVHRLLSAVDDADAAVACGDRDHWTCLATRASSLTQLLSAYDGGERALHRVFGRLRVARVGVEEREMVNVNEAADLAGLIAHDLGDHR